MVCGIVIVHGKSEKNIAEYLRSNFRVSLEIYAERGGRNSIQIDGLKTVLNNNKFGNKTNFKNWIQMTPAQLEKNNFKIFTIMDLDDVSDISVKNNYRDGHLSGIGEHWLKNFIVPIYCDTNLEDVLKDISYPYAHRNKDKKKYIEVFPINHNDDKNDLENIEDFLKKLRNCTLTNLEVFVQFCFDNKSDFS